MSEKIDWHNAQFTAEDLKEHFGLEAGGGTFGSSNAQLGKNYLSAADVDRLKSDPMIKEAYFALRGEEHARKEHWDQDGNEGFELGEGSLDALLDDITADKEDAPPAPEAPKMPVVLSPEHQKAQDIVKQWEDDVWSGKQAAEMYDTPLKRGQLQAGKKAAEGFLNDKVYQTKGAIARAASRIKSGGGSVAPKSSPMKSAGERAVIKQEMKRG